MPIEYYPLKIMKKEEESKDVFSFYLSAPQEHKEKFYFQPAQFLTFQFTLNGKSFFRSYSIASSPLKDDLLKITLTKVQGGLVSHYMIDHLKEGDEILSQTPCGSFYKLPDQLKQNQYVLFAAGVGITPLYSILQTVLESFSQDKVFLIYSCRNPKEVIYQKDLQQCLDTHKDRLKVKIIFSSTEGRLDDKKLLSLFSDNSFKDSLFYLCGPKQYMDMIKDFLKNKQISTENIHTEDFKVTPIRGPKPDESSVFFEAGHFEEGEPEKLKARIYDEDVEIPLDRETSLLEQLLEEGHQPPFSCTSGSCLTCMAKLKEGKVFQLDEGILDEENIKSLELLTCQCYPLSKKVVIDYDDL